ncbi:ATPase/histidine kinase/DNA gyrase B/HSP90 domain protein [Bulleidia extructa W1219]|uniref:histidine kinase n=1 Tax=Bulleidia extructa W1219 TaxID=679192 RepID=D2MMU3_9FIRM|nr:HAMP domain-containing sensor histidine kinase [Bulleidia extructa]EFC06369.1 ATPase/histidine kinase/DNA gyrase B/HSP90 domain protein [Bulleidia extructa W1219]
MKLGNKTFLYSVIIAFITGMVIFSYMIFLMPAMYMDYKEKQNRENAKSSLAYFKDHESLKGMEMRDSGVFGIAIPDKGYTIKIAGSGFEGNIEFISPSARKLIDQIRSLNQKSFEKSDDLFQKFKPLLSSVLHENMGEIKKNFKFTMDVDKSVMPFKAQKRKIHMLGGGMGMGEFTVKSNYSGTSYTNFVGFVKKGKTMLVIVNSVMTPTAKEILPVIYGSIPTLVLLMIILAFGVSEIYSKKIVKPIKKLSIDAEKRMYASSYSLDPLEVSGKDEIADLTTALNLLYQKQAQAVEELEEENKRKEVYMRALSHQLKTPVTASLLLVDGMIGKVGKFGDREIYLPEVKDQLQEMMSIINEASSIHHMSDQQEIEWIDLEVLCREIIEKNRINAEAKGITLRIENPEKKVYWQKNVRMLRKILENLIVNGIDHTTENGDVKLIIQETKIRVLNHPGHIEEGLIENIFEPFVTSVQEENLDKQKGHGLGLYIAKYFAGKLGLELKGKNLQDGVEFMIEKRGKND